jgi:transposase
LDKLKKRLAEWIIILRNSFHSIKEISNITGYSARTIQEYISRARARGYINTLPEGFNKKRSAMYNDIKQCVTRLNLSHLLSQYDLDEFPFTVKEIAEQVKIPVSTCRNMIKAAVGIDGYRKIVISSRSTH